MWIQSKLLLCTQVLRQFLGVVGGLININDITTHTKISLYDRLYWTPVASSKQPLKDNEVLVSDWLPISRMWHEKVSSGTFTCNEPIMYPKILKHGLPALRLEFMVLSRFIMYYRVFIRRLYANGYVSFRPKFWSAGSYFYLKILEKYLASRCEFGAAIKPRPPT